MNLRFNSAGLVNYVSTDFIFSVSILAVYVSKGRLSLEHGAWYSTSNVSYLDKR